MFTRTSVTTNLYFSSMPHRIRYIDEEGAEVEIVTDNTFLFPEECPFLKSLLYHLCKQSNTAVVYWRKPPKKKKKKQPKSQVKRIKVSVRND